MSYPSVSRNPGKPRIGIKRKTPYNAPPVLKNCHDVRRLTACPLCHGLGDKDNTIRGGIHGRCYVGFYGLPALLSLEDAELNKLTLGDIGAETMRAILERSTK